MSPAIDIIAALLLAAAPCAPDDLNAFVAALEAHPAAAAEAAAGDVARGRAKARRGMPDPMLRLEVRGAPLTEPHNLGRTPMGGVAIQAMQKLPFGPRLDALGDADEADADATTHRRRERALGLAADGLELALDRRLLVDEGALLVEQRALLEALAAVAEARASVRADASVDLSLLQARAAMLRAELDARAARAEGIARALAATYVDVDVPVCAPDVDGEATASGRPARDALAAKRRAAELQEKAARLSWVPEPQIGAGYVVRPDSGAADGIDFLGLSLQVNLPILVERREGAADAARAKAARARALDDAFVRDASARVEMAHGKARAARAKVRALREEALPTVQAAVNAAKARYETGEGMLGPVLDAERQALEVRTAILRAERQDASARVWAWRLTWSAP
jgi:outer membrane protein TolC